MYEVDELCPRCAAPLKKYWPENEPEGDSFESWEFYCGAWAFKISEDMTIMEGQCLTQNSPCTNLDAGRLEVKELLATMTKAERDAWINGNWSVEDERPV